MAYRLKIALIVVLQIAVLVASTSHAMAYAGSLVCAGLYFFWARRGLRTHEPGGKSAEAPSARTVLVRIVVAFAPLLLVGGFWALTAQSYALGAGLLLAFAVAQAIRLRSPTRAP